METLDDGEIRNILIERFEIGSVTKVFTSLLGQRLLRVPAIGWHSRNPKPSHRQFTTF
jgi:hypothetical protein